MSNKKLKLVRYIFLIVGLLAIIGFSLNWFFTYRLENFLREKLNDKIAEATDSFYRASFESLSVGLFNGELTIKGLVLEPDSATFQEWKAIDSLPQTYLKLNIKSIEFKGVNLAWRINYRRLHFDLFEIQSPKVEAFEAYNSRRFEKKIKNTESKSLYETVSPFFDIVSVKRMNLVNATIAFTVEDPATPSIYTLKDVNFYTYGFYLDKNSSKSGKLLYCDNFEFFVEKPQTILNTPELLLNADTIKLSTIDSVAQIKGVSVEPQEALWKKENIQPDNYIKAKLKAVEVAGVKFTRINGENHLEARSFDIIASDLHYFQVDNNEKDTLSESEKHKVDTLIRSWSLYNIVSPVFSWIAIGRIGIDDAKFQYSVIKGTLQDDYTLERLDVHTRNFLVDSLSDVHNRYWHSDSFELGARGLKGVMPSKNHTISIGRIAISMLNKYLRVEDINIAPISTSTQYDYLSGSIKLISFDDFVMSKGIEAGQLRISSPIVKYTRTSATKIKKEDSNKDLARSENVSNLGYPFLTHLSIGKINMSNADITYENKVLEDSYALHKLNVYATNFLINDDTRRKAGYPFIFDDFGFRFSNFDNVLPGKDYRLKIKDASYASNIGKLSLKDFELIPMEQVKQKMSGTYLSLSFPSLTTERANYKYPDKILNVGTLHLDSPALNIVKQAMQSAAASSKTSSANQLLPYLRYINIGQIDLKNVDLSYYDKQANDNLSTTLDLLSVNNIAWEVEKAFNVSSIMVDKPRIDVENNSTKVKSVLQVVPSKRSLSPFGNISVDRLDVMDMGLSLLQPNLNLAIESEQIAFSGLDWNAIDSILNLKSFVVVHPLANILEKTSETGVKNSSSTDIYDIVGKHARLVSIGNFNISEAKINYTTEREGESVKQQKLNRTSLQVDSLMFDSRRKSIELKDIAFDTRDLSIPLKGGFYTLNIGNAFLNKKQSIFKVDNLHLVATYPMMEFAYHHPLRKDWFDIAVGNITLSGIDVEPFLSGKGLRARNFEVSDVLLQNFKNQQLTGKRRISPMVYQGLQRMPLKISFDNTDVRNFTVEYYELAKKGISPGRLVFQNMNARITGLTNIVEKPKQYIHLEADGKIMGTGLFTATWMIPVDSLNDHFRLSAHVTNFDLTQLNELITPLAPAEVSSGVLKDLTFETNASSIGASVQLKFLYNNLNIAVFKDAELGIENKFYTTLANRIIRSDNPNKVDAKPRTSDISITRDPYHSTFNYFWQILRPSLTESVGVSQKKQNFIKKVSDIVSSVKNFFSFRKKNKDQDKKEEPKSDR